MTAAHTLVDEERAAIQAEGAPAARPVVITTFDRHDKPLGRRVTTTWEHVIAQAVADAQKPHDDRGWSFATFKGDKRAKANVESVSALTFDLEAMGKGQTDPLRLGDPHRAAELFDGTLGIVHTTRSHREDAPRSRLVLVLSRPVTAGEYEALWLKVAGVLTGAALRPDPAAKDPSRFWFHASQPTLAEPIVLRLEGEPLDVDALLAEPTAPPVATPLRAPMPPDQGPERYLRKALESAVGRLHMAPQGERNDTLAREAYGIGQACATAKASTSEARASLRAAISGWDPSAMAHHEGTLDRQIAEGLKHPRQLPDRRLPSSVTATKAANDDGADHAPIRIQSDLALTMREALARLPNNHDLLQRGGSLVRVLRGASGEPDAQLAALLSDSPRAVRIDGPVLRVELAELAEWQRYDGRSGAWKACRPDDHVVAAILSLGQWPGVRPLVGIAETPILRPDGTVCDVAGYDATTGYVYVPSANFGAIPDRPTRDDARKAYADLAEPFGEFPWAAPSGVAAAVTGILTLLTRAAIDGPVPALIFDKNTPGTGGSLATDLVGLVASGRTPPRMTWPRSPEELGKVLDSCALRGASSICFDNIATPFCGDALDKFLTATSVTLRILGKTEERPVEWRALVMGSGNNVAIAGDTVRRVLRPRMETLLERPQDRDGFRIPDPRAWVKLHRIRLVRAALTLVRAYLVAGRPDPLKPWGTFEAWTALPASAVAWASGIDPLGARVAPDDDGADPTLAAHLTLVQLLPKLAGDRGITIRSLLGTLYPQGRAPSEGPPDGFDDLREALEVLCPPKLQGLAPEALRVGHKLKAMTKVVRGGGRLVSKQDRNGTAQWHVERCG